MFDIYIHVYIVLTLNFFSNPDVDGVHQDESHGGTEGQQRADVVGVHDVSEGQKRADLEGVQDELAHGVTEEQQPTDVEGVSDQLDPRDFPPPLVDGNSFDILL